MSDTKNKEYIVGSDGNLEYYPQLYNSTPQELEDATTLETYILTQQKDIETSFLKIGAALHIFKENKYYLARGVPNFTSWIREYVHMTPEHASRLIRIVHDLIPILGDNINPDKLPAVSTMKEMLPMLTEKNEHEIRYAYDEIKDLNSVDARKRLRELRGIVEPPIPTTFRAKVREVDDVVFVNITRFGDDGDIYTVTQKPLLIKKKDWPRWQDRFGAFVQVEE